MRGERAGKSIRDPLWSSIAIDDLALGLVDTAAFQRLRYVRQLGLAFLVYPGATHSRFEHALGAYHLARRTLRMLEEAGELGRVAPEECAIVRAAALLHDVGHYPFSHALEEIGAPHHESVAQPILSRGEVADKLRQIAPDAPSRVHALIRGDSGSPLQGLISGSLDLDKIEYLKRDALMCGVPYGEIDVDRLLASLTLLEHPESGALVVGVREKGLSALESLLFAKYQMYRNVYWHHAVRSATAMYKRLVNDALRAGVVTGDELASFTDEGLLHRLEERAMSPLLVSLRSRRLYKRALECPASDLEEGCAEWIATDHPLTRRVENRLAEELGLEPGALLLDFPEKPQMLGLDIPVRRKDGSARQLTATGWPGAIDLPALSDELYRSTRWLRVFTSRPITIRREALIALARHAPSDVAARLDAGTSLLSG